MKLIARLFKVVLGALVLCVATLIILFYSTYRDYYRRVSANESLKYGLAVTTATADYFAVERRLPDRLGVLDSLPGRPTWLREIEYDNRTGTVRIRSAHEPDGADAIDLVPEMHSGSLVYQCKPAGISPEFLPKACTSSARP